MIFFIYKPRFQNTVRPCKLVFKRNAGDILAVSVLPDESVSEDCFAGPSESETDRLQAHRSIPHSAENIAAAIQRFIVFASPFRTNHS